MLSISQQKRLQEQVRPRIDGKFQHTENEKLDQVVLAIRQESPGKFHTPETLKSRVFMHEPRTRLPMAGYIHPCPPLL